jgi:hypothetical protein
VRNEYTSLAAPCLKKITQVDEIDQIYCFYRLDRYKLYLIYRGERVELRQLRYFLAVAECESFTKGAEKVAISQPSLSVQIAALEYELGAPLFDRLGRRVALTEAGRLFSRACAAGDP